MKNNLQMTINQKKLQFIFNLRSANVIDSTLLSVMEQIPRCHFISDSFKNYVFEDTAIPIDCGQTTTQPSIIGLMIQALEITPRCKILEVGTGSGYQTSILASLGRRIYSLERCRKLAIRAKTSIESLSIFNVTVIFSDGLLGLKKQEPFDRIILSAAVDDVPNPLMRQLKPNGILVAPVGRDEQLQTIVKVKKIQDKYYYSDIKKTKFLSIIEGTEL